MRLVILLSLLLLIACTKSYTLNDLEGKYVISKGTETDTIELKSNGSYIHSHKSKDGLVSQQVGNWKLENLQSGQTISLDGFYSLFGDKRSEKEIYLLLVKTSFGKTTLITNIDTNEGYEKK